MEIGKFMILLQIRHPGKMAGMSRTIAYTLRLPLVLLLAVFGTACGNSDTFTGPDAPTPTLITEPTFAGVLNRNGAATYAFGVSTPGTITATLTSLSPENAVIGFALGTWNSRTELCQIVLANDNAVSGKVIVGSAQTSDNYCVRTFDIGKITDAEPASFEVVVSHF